MWYDSVCVSRLVESVDLSISLYKLYPARSPPAGWSCVTNKTREEVDLCPLSGDDIRSHLHPDLPNLHRNSTDQATMQAVSLIITLLLSAVRLHNTTLPSESALLQSYYTVEPYPVWSSGSLVAVVPLCQWRLGMTAPASWTLRASETQASQQREEREEREERGEREERVGAISVRNK